MSHQQRAALASLSGGLCSGRCPARSHILRSATQLNTAHSSSEVQGAEGLFGVVDHRTDADEHECLAVLGERVLREGLGGRIE